MSFLVHKQTIRQALEHIRPLFPPTPLELSGFLKERYGADIYLKREDQTPVRSYKIRGAYHFLLRALEENSGETPLFVCASAGNHSQGFAYACAAFEVNGVVYMPITAPRQKLQRTKKIGGPWIEVRQQGDTFETAQKAALAFCQDKKTMFVPPYDHPWIIVGQGTVGAEISDAIPHSPDIILAPVGGGGLTAGLCSWFSEDDTEIIGVEPQGAPSLSEGLKKNERICLESTDGFVDGASVAQIGKHTWDILKEYVHREVQLVPEDRLCQTILHFLSHEGFIMEPAGALAIDALQNFSRKFLAGKVIVCVVTGSNLDFDRLSDIKERAEKYVGLRKYFILHLPQRPGALREFLKCLGENDDVFRFEYLKKSMKNFGSALVGIETNHSKNFVEIIKNMDQHGFSFRDVTDDRLMFDFLI